MESPRKFNDCYFYYYSTCTKGDNCVFRHEPSALGCETMCTAWQQGKCLDKRCKLRHMELRKNRKQIPCYWENQPGGCRKKHCPFMHKNPDARTDGIAPSQPAPAQPVSASATEGAGEQPALAPTVPAPPVGVGVGVGVPPQPVPMLWQHQHQQQRQVVLDSAILGVLPSSELLGGGRRVLTHHEATNAYVSPIDPLVVNFEEESDNESAPSSTPTKRASPDDEQRIARTKSQELLLLEKIQAEAAAFYSYDALPPAPDPPRERKLVRTNLSTKYERLSLDEIAGKQQPTALERRKSLDFKVLSLEEIRARKKTESMIHSTPIALNLTRKRKLSTQETITSSGNKIIKVVRSNSVVYKKVEHITPATSSQAKIDQKQSENNVESRKRTISEQSCDIYNMQEDELLDNCFEFKRINIVEQTTKPRLVRNRYDSTSAEKSLESNDTGCKEDNDNDSDSEVQIVSVEIPDNDDTLSDPEVIEVGNTNINEPIDIVDLSDDVEESDVAISDLKMGKSVPDVVASCHKNKGENSDKSLLNDIDYLLDENNEDDDDLGFEDEL